MNITTKKVRTKGGKNVLITKKSNLRKNLKENIFANIIGFNKMNYSKNN